LPRLILFVPCERVILNQEDNNVSLITVLNEISIALPSDKIPSGSHAAYRWTILAVWLREPGDEQKRFEQSCELVMPDGQRAFRSRDVFSFEQRIHRQTLVVPAFPMSKTPGDCLLKLSVREDVEGKEWQGVAEYPILLKHSTPDVR
jgi:hypothetical protein